MAVKTRMKTKVPRTKGSECHEWPDEGRMMDKLRRPMSPGVVQHFPKSEKPMRNRRTGM